MNDDYPEISAERGIPRKWWSYLGKALLLCLAAGAAIAYLNLDAKSWQRLTAIPASIIVLLGLMVGTAWICNGVRTFLLARAFGHRLSVKRAVGITLSMEFAIAATPGGLGGLPTRILLQRRSGIPVHQSMAMIAADVSADILFFFLISPFALRAVWKMAPVRNALQELGWTDLGLIMGALAGTAFLLYFAVPRVFRLGNRFRRLRRLFVRMRREGRLMRHSIAYMWGHGRIWYAGAFLFCSIQWTCRYGILPVILWTLGSSIDPFALIYLQGILFLVALLLVVPGGGGSLEILSTLILQPVAGSETAALAVILWRIFTYYLYIAGGSIAAVIQLLHPPKMVHAASVDPTLKMDTSNDHPAA
ncbi:MAG: lysylphosphatidylglycerol synthase transmembrane domain-containing protein [Oceanipulchritudo sp.]